MTHSGVFVGKVYCRDSLYVVNDEKSNTNTSSYAYITKSFDTWYGRLSHANMQTLKIMKN